MDRDIWNQLAKSVKACVRKLPRPRRRFDYSDGLIVQMWLWAVFHDRPLSWASQRTSYSSLFRPRRLPSNSQFNKRVNTFRFGRLRILLHRELTRKGRDDLISKLDGMPMPVREHSTDRQARSGPAGRKIRRGYKLHSRAGCSGFFPEYSVLPMNEAEPSTARKLLKSLPAGSLVLADANYDSFRLYREIDRRGGQLLTYLRGPLARSEPLIKKITPARRWAVRQWQSHRERCERILHHRDDIERRFAHLTSCGGGLITLPPWVRGRRRVRLWVDAKLAIYHARLLARRAKQLSKAG